MSEYYNKSPGSAACAYHTLANYNFGYGGGAMAPVPAGTPSMSTIVVPVYGMMGYDTLQHGMNQAQLCGSYFSIKDAYPSFPKACTAFTSRLCS